jgi:hypothetical protein
MYMFLVYSWYGQRSTEPTMSKAYRNNPQRAQSSQSRYTFYEFDQDFPDDAACMDWLVGFLYR